MVRIFGISFIKAATNAKLFNREINLFKCSLKEDSPAHDK